MAKISWRAVYKDGAVLEQFRKDGTENKYTDIDRNELEYFILLYNLKPRVVLYFNGNKRLIYRRRVVIDGMNSQIHAVVYFAGWQELVNGKNVQAITFLFEDGHIEVVDRFYEGHPWYYPTKFMPEEEPEHDD